MLFETGNAAYQGLCRETISHDSVVAPDHRDMVANSALQRPAVCISSVSGVAAAQHSVWDELLLGCRFRHGTHPRDPPPVHLHDLEPPTGKYDAVTGPRHPPQQGEQQPGQGVIAPL